MFLALTQVLAHSFADFILGTEGVEFVVLVELAEGHAQAVVWEDQEHLVQQARQRLQLQLWTRRRETLQPRL